MEKKFKTQYPNICTWLNEWDLVYKFFTAYAVKTVKVGNTRIPIEGYSPLEHSEGVDTAMYWLLNMEKP